MYRKRHLSNDSKLPRPPKRTIGLNPRKRLSPRLTVLGCLVVLCALLLSPSSLFKSQAQGISQIEAASSLAAFQPSGSIYATFFYPWYKNPTTDGAWGNWEGNGHSPANNWFSNYLPLPPGSLDATTGAIHPNIGLYSSRDKGVFYWQLSQMAAAKLEVAISSWWGQSVSPTNDSPGPNAVQGRPDYTFRQIVTNWMNQPDNPYPNMRWSLYYEKESVGNPSVAEIAADLQYINMNYVNQPSYLKIGGRPVLFVYADATDGCSMVDRWLQARAMSGTTFYLVLKLFSGYTNCSSKPDSWHQYAPANRSGNYAPFSSYISPGFWKDGNSALLPRSVSAFDAAAATMVSATTQWKLVETWNEWGEGTSVEPGIQVQQTKSGNAGVAANGSPFQSQFIQVMAQRFPALPAGTGAGSQAVTPTNTPIATSTPKPATPTPSPTQKTIVSTTTPTLIAPTPIPSATNTIPAPVANVTQGTSVFLIMMENHNWNQIKGSASAPYINGLLSQGAHAEAYYNPPGIHPSLPNYLWLEAGTNFGIANDNPPSSNHQSTTAHLTTQLNTAGISWKSYQEDISGTNCPLSGTGHYAPKHNPMIYFDDVTGTNNPNSANCISHVRPYSELGRDLSAGTIARYNFITPNLCDDMHDSSGCATTNSVKNGDNWLAQAVPAILASNAYKNGGIVIITWDEGEGGDGPIGMIVLSQNAKRGYSNTIRYTHGSTLRTLQEIFGVRPFLGDAAKATDLSDLFTNMASSAGGPTATPAATNTPTPTLSPTNTPTGTQAATSTPASTSGGSLTFSPVADTCIDASHPSTNYGISTMVRTDASPVIQTYLLFNVQGISGSVTSAKLRVYANSSSSMKYDVRSVSNTSWGEKTLTYNNAPAASSVINSSAPSFAANSWTEVDVTSLIQTNGLVSLALTSANNTAVSFSSKEGTHPPQLIVQTGAGAAAVQSLRALAAVSNVANTDTSTPTDTATPTLTDTATATPTATATVLPTNTPTLAPTDTATLTPTSLSAAVAPSIPAGLTLIESDSPVVAGVSAWRQVSQPSGASGSTYLVNLVPSGTLALHFQGNTIGVGFISGPSFGQFTIVVDGVTKQVVNSNGQAYQLDQVIISDLSDGDHDVQIIASAGVVGIDSFFISNAPSTVVAAAPTAEATTAAQPTVVAPTDVIPTTQSPQDLNTPTTEPAASLPTALPFPTLALPTEDASVPTQAIPATDEVAPPTALAFPTLDISGANTSVPTSVGVTQTPELPISTLPIYANMDDGASDWQPTGTWALNLDSAHGGTGLGWTASGGNADILHWNRQINLRGVAGAQLSFQTQLSSANAPLLAQVSLDGVTWTTVATVMATDDWQLTNVDLGVYIGQVIQLQFVWLSSQPGDVLHLDDVTVVTPAAIPTVAATVSETPASNDVPTTEPPSITPSPTVADTNMLTPAAPTETPIVAESDVATATSPDVTPEATQTS